MSVDQTPIRGSLRSNPATYTGLLDPICTAFAKANGMKPACSAPTPRAPAPAATAPFAIRLQFRPDLAKFVNS